MPALLGALRRLRGLLAREHDVAAGAVCWATGGPQQYSGRSMKDSHAHLKITPAEWDVFAEDFATTLAKFNVPEAESAELFAILGSESCGSPAAGPGRIGGRGTAARPYRRGRYRCATGP